MSNYIDKPLSLIERKKLQWAKEKEELEGLCAPWAAKEPQLFEKSLQRNKNGSKIALNNNNDHFRKDFSRRSSLPPLYKNQYNSIDKEMGGEQTSGYGSDNNQHNSENNLSANWNQSGYESSSSYKDDRPKWKEKNKVWETEPPNWVKRGLQTDEEIIVANSSPAESPQQDDAELERPYTSSECNRTYIRGQNIPVDSIELAERERRRQIALAHQEAVRQQLEERERKKQEEKKRRIKEELEEELRIEKEQEIERLRKEEELKIIKEKQDREQKRKQAMKEALELAEKEAKLQKIKQKIKKQSNIIDEDNINEECHNVIHNKIEPLEIKNTNLELQSNMIVSPRNNDITTANLEVTGKSLTPRNIESRSEIKYSSSPYSLQIVATPRNEMALIVQTPLETLQNMQYAVLMPSSGGPSSGVPIAIPLALAPDKISVGNSTSRTENRILTPTQFRNRNKLGCDMSTQTEDLTLDNLPNNQKYIIDKLNNLEINSRKERKLKSEDRGIDDKPKWGANRPPTRYLKQSEKDPFYQRRKMRQKVKDYKNSSDESQTASPRSYRKKNYIEKRHTRAQWRKNDHYFARNIRMYQTEIVPLESDKEYIHYKCECCCNCRKSREIKTEILKIEHSPRDLDNATYIVDKLTSIHKPDPWRTPRTPSLSSSTRNTTENN